MKRRIAALLAALMCLALAGCMREAGTDNGAGEGAVQGAVQGESGREDAGEKPELPDGLETGGDGVPVLTVYVAREDRAEQMDIETYVAGVVAGEMKNDWPEEALKAQAILARTFTLKFLQDKSSKYGGADISTDVSEAQAYSAQDVNDRVRKAASDTRGQVLCEDGEYVYAWFHAHAGGMTEVPSVALNYGGEDPEYLAPTRSPDSDKAPEDVKRWTAVFAAEQVAKACADAGEDVGAIRTVEIGQKGESGRAKTFVVNGREVNAPEMRIHLDASKLKSTLVDEVEVNGGQVTFTGRGFGHGVGMSQWGAYQMADEGRDAREIVEYYFQDADVVTMW